MFLLELFFFLLFPELFFSPFLAFVFPIFCQNFVSMLFVIPPLIFSYDIPVSIVVLFVISSLMIHGFPVILAPFCPCLFQMFSTVFSFAGITLFLVGSSIFFMFCCYRSFVLFTISFIFFSLFVFVFAPIFAFSRSCP